MRRHSFSARFLILLSLVAVFGTALVAARQSASQGSTGSSVATQQRIYLVFPFENAGASPRLDWLGEGLEELTIQRLAGAGEHVYSRAGRLVEQERYGLPRSSKLSRATMLRIGEDLDADFVIFGRYTSNTTSLTIESRILKVSPARLLPPIRETGTLASLMDLHTRLVWRMLSSSDRNYSLNLAAFTKRQRPLRLDAFEHYVRGLLASEDDARLRELRPASRWAKRISPGATANPRCCGTRGYQRLMTATCKRFSQPVFAGFFSMSPIERRKCSHRCSRPRGATWSPERMCPKS